MKILKWIGWKSKCAVFFANRLMFLVTHSTLQFDTNARKLMPVKDLDYFRQWTSNVVPFSIKLQFQRLKFNCSSTQSTGNKGF